MGGLFIFALFDGVEEYGGIVLVKIPDIPEEGQVESLVASGRHVDPCFAIFAPYAA